MRERKHMKVKIGWWRRDPELGKLKIQVFFHARALFWEVQSGRFNTWRPMTPTEEDWAHLEDDVRRRVSRGLMQREQLDLVLRRGAEG